VLMLQLYRYLTFSAVRYPSGVVQITGLTGAISHGLSAPAAPRLVAAKHCYGPLTCRRHLPLSPLAVAKPATLAFCQAEPDGILPGRDSRMCMRGTTESCVEVIH
jgi:hypothetical protein